MLYWCLLNYPTIYKENLFRACYRAHIIWLCIPKRKNDVHYIYTVLYIFSYCVMDAVAQDKLSSIIFIYIYEILKKKFYMSHNLKDHGSSQESMVCILVKSSLVLDKKRIFD